MESRFIKFIKFSVKFSKEQICRLLKTRKSRRIAESRQVCVGLKENLSRIIHRMKVIQLYEVKAWPFGSTDFYCANLA